MPKRKAIDDHFGDLLRAMITENRVATKFSPGRTKTTAILKTLATEVTDSAAHQMTTGPFIIGTDCSQELGGGDKVYPVVVQFLNGDCVSQTELLGVPTCSEASYDKNIYLLLEYVPYCLKYIYLTSFLVVEVPLHFCLKSL